MFLPPNKGQVLLGLLCNVMVAVSLDVRTSASGWLERLVSDMGVTCRLKRKATGTYSL